MANDIATNEHGIEAPARVLRPYWSTYFHIASKKNYRQMNPDTDNNWVEIVEGSAPAPPTPHTPPTNLGNAVIVSSQGLTVADGALVESWTYHFSDINEAIAASRDGDTIYVYGGSHNVFTNMVPVGKTIKWMMLGGPTLRGFTTMVADNGTPAVVNIKGDAFFEALASTAFFFTAPDTLAHIECQRITAPGFGTLRLEGGQVGSYIKVAESIKVTGSGTCIRFAGNSNWTLDCPHMENAAVAGGNRKTIESTTTYVGTSTINGGLIIQTSAYHGNGCVGLQGGVGSKFTINVSDKIQSSAVTAGGKTNHAVLHQIDDLTINGDIDGNAGLAIWTSTNSAVAVMTHNGNAWNDGQAVLVDIEAFDKLIKLNGIYTSSNQTVIEHGNTPLEFDGEIRNTKSDGNSRGIYMTNLSGIVFNNAKIVMTIFDGSEESIVSAGGAKTVKIVGHLSSNVPLGAVPAVTNSIGYSTYGMDAGVE
jgi:hypothetical protein